jgi:hypothetical protein
MEFPVDDTLPYDPPLILEFLDGDTAFTASESNRERYYHAYHILWDEHIPPVPYRARAAALEIDHGTLIRAYGKFAM